LPPWRLMQIGVSLRADAGWGAGRHQPRKPTPMCINRPVGEGWGGGTRREAADYSAGRREPAPHAFVVVRLLPTCPPTLPSPRGGEVLPRVRVGVEMKPISYHMTPDEF